MGPGDRFTGRQRAHLVVDIVYEWASGMVSAPKGLGRGAVVSDGGMLEIRKLAVGTRANSERKKDNREDEGGEK